MAMHAFALALLAVTSPSTLEAPAPKLQGGQLGFHGSIYAQSGFGVATGASGGLGLGVLYRGETWGVDAQGRAALIGDDKHSVMGLTAQLGPRLYLGRGDIAPYVGAGLSIGTFHAGTAILDVDDVGPGAYGVAGIELFRTSKVALGGSVQIDAPFYWLKGDEKNAATGRWAGVERWVAPISFNIDMVIR